MSTCYTCGRHIEPTEPSLRRRVRTGDRTRVSFRTGKVVEGVTTFGQRTVCRRCAARIDHVAQRMLLWRHLSAVGALLLLCGVLSIV